ncbi:hypothetical protein F4777DRAFT_541809 [Nemania sp. FL0916]|nr:hypothetical protein F4777DRAFT_541809 [Nemania sp. FL0916]
MCILAEDLPDHRADKDITGGDKSERIFRDKHNLYNSPNFTTALYNLETPSRLHRSQIENMGSCFSFLVLLVVLHYCAPIRLLSLLFSFSYYSIVLLFQLGLARLLQQKIYSAVLRSSSVLALRCTPCPPLL